MKNMTKNSKNSNNSRKPIQYALSLEVSNIVDDDEFLRLQ